MIRTAITTCLVPEARKGPFVLHGDIRESCRIAREIGFDAIELFAPSAEALPGEELSAIIGEEGLDLAAVGTGAGWLQHRLSLCDPDPGRRSRARDFIAERIRYGARFGAPAIIGSMQGSHGREIERNRAMSWLRSGLEELGSLAGDEGVFLLYEPLNRYETDLCNTLAQGMELCNELSTGHVHLLADVFHMNIEEADPAKALGEAMEQVRHVHMVDSNRRAPGMGHMDLRAIARVIRDADYRGYLSAECFPLPDPRTAAETALETWNRFLR